MLISIFKKDTKNQSNEKEVENKNKDFDENKIFTGIQDYLINNYLVLLQKNNIEAVKEKIIEQLSNKYLIKDINEQKKYLDKITSKIFGYDILQKYIDNADISDIRTVAWNQIYIKSKGKWEKAVDFFTNKEEYELYVRYVVLKNGGKINFESPIITLSDKKYNLRIEAGIAPVNVSESSLVIRIHRYSKEITLESLFIEHEMMNDKIYLFLLNAIKEKQNIVIAGKGASGKTSLLRGIINAMDENIAITTNEETCELYIENKNIIQREIVQNRKDGSNIELEELTSHSLVMSNEVIIIGEIKGKESLAFFDAISTGHVGYTTVHSDKAENTIDRIVTLMKRDTRAQMYKDEYLEKLLASTMDIIIYMKDFKIYEITKICYNKKATYKTLYKQNVISTPFDNAVMYKGK